MASGMRFLNLAIAMSNTLNKLGYQIWETEQQPHAHAKWLSSHPLLWSGNGLMQHDNRCAHWSYGVTLQLLMGGNGCYVG